ncbi:G-protein coupled receptor 157-like [Dendronephthya gigantea]|uniref:G-protein coupled receptor 157-like n=1 Tax=Dendronephthya gigantea TaxID=151771 RepID=UPI00106A9148|nr:G-protein coupled receptor 157-like [Dendronephthya gigantea]
MQNKDRNMDLSTINLIFQTTEKTTSYWGESFAQLQNYRILKTVISSLSIFGSLAIILTYFLFQDLQTTSRKFLVCISIGDFFTVLPYLIKTWTVNSHMNCVAQSFVSTTAVMWSFFWTSSLAIYLYLVIVKKNQGLADKLMPYFHVINWGFPLTLVAASWNKLGQGYAHDSGGWCWIDLIKMKKDEAIVWMLACGKFWEILSYFVDVILCFIVTRKLNAEVKERQNINISSESTQATIQGKRKLIWAPLLFVFLRIWGTIRFLLFCFKSHQGQGDLSETLIVCHIIGDSSQGFVYFILFCLLTRKFRENICGAWCRFRKVKIEGRPDSLKSHKHRYLLENQKNIVFYT